MPFFKTRLDIAIYLQVAEVADIVVAEIEPHPLPVFLLNEGKQCHVEREKKDSNLGLVQSFEKKINRVWVHTCSLDHKNALNNYISRGMKIFKTEILNI